MNSEMITETFRFGNHQLKIKRISDLDKLIDQISDKEFEKDERLPYWAELWPSAIGLCRFLAGHEELIRNKSVLELGCGLGLTSLIISALKPHRFLATDYEPNALRMTELNFKLNDLQPPSTAILDWRAPRLNEQFEIIAASDVAYEERFFEPLVHLFGKFMRPGGQIILAEPSRSIAQKFFDLLKSYGYQSTIQWQRVLQGKHEINVQIHLIHKMKM